MKIAHDTLVLVADGRKRLLLRNEGDEAIPVLQTIEQAAIANPPAHELGTDQPGRGFASVGTRRSSYAETDWHQQAESRFAAETARRLAELAGRDDRDVMVVAPPKFLGELRRYIEKSLAARIVAEIPKDLAHHLTDDIVRTISAYRV